MRGVFIVMRLGTAVLIAAAIGAQLQVTMAFYADRPPVVPTAAANFFSFFTIQSNLIACAALLIGGVLLLRSRDLTVPEPRWFAVLLAAATTYMLTTGIVYNTLLRGIELPQGSTVPWSNEVLHVIAPVYLAIDLFFAPRRRRLGWGAILIIVGYPIVWAVYTLVRGPLITAPLTGDPWWYPYPFLDPHQVPGGYLGVAGYIVGIAVLIAALAALVVWYGRARGIAPGETAVTPEADVSAPRRG